MINFNLPRTGSQKSSLMTNSTACSTKSIRHYLVASTIAVAVLTSTYVIADQTPTQENHATVSAVESLNSANFEVRSLYSDITHEGYQSFPINVDPLLENAPGIGFTFDEARLGGFERKKIDGIKVRGWQMGNAFIGQAKVADKWGLGFVYQQGDLVYGVNHRGIEVSRRF